MAEVVGEVIGGIVGLLAVYYLGRLAVVLVIAAWRRFRLGKRTDMRTRRPTYHNARSAARQPA
jgi:hypothetical protein